MRKAKSGNIVNISSLAGRRGVSPLGGYSSTKFAMVGMTEALRVELFNTGIKVSLAMPGVIDTPMARNALKHDTLKGVSAMMAMPARWVTWAVWPRPRSASPKWMSLPARPSQKNSRRYSPASPTHC